MSEVLTTANEIESQRAECRADRPYDKNLYPRWAHPDSESLGLDGWDEYWKYKCRVCGLTFEVAGDLK